MVSMETGRGWGSARGGEVGWSRRAGWGGVAQQLPINAALLLGPAIEISETTAAIEMIFSSAAANIGAGSVLGKYRRAEDDTNSSYGQQ